MGIFAFFEPDVDCQLIAGILEPLIGVECVKEDGNFVRTENSPEIVIVDLLRLYGRFTVTEPMIPLLLESCLVILDHQRDQITEHALQTIVETVFGFPSNWVSPFMASLPRVVAAASLPFLHSLFVSRVSPSFPAGVQIGALAGIGSISGILGAAYGPQVEELRGAVFAALAQNCGRVRNAASACVVRVCESCGSAGLVTGLWELARGSGVSAAESAGVLEVLGLMGECGDGDGGDGGGECVNHERGEHGGEQAIVGDAGSSTNPASGNSTNDHSNDTNPASGNSTNDHTNDTNYHTTNPNDHNNPNTTHTTHNDIEQAILTVADETPTQPASPLPREDPNPSYADQTALRLCCVSLLLGRGVSPH